MPSISDIVTAVIEAIASLFGGSSSDIIKQAMTTAMATPTANLKGHAFTQAYGTVGGLAIIFAVIFVLIHAVVLIVRRRNDEAARAVGAFTGAGKVFAMALLLPGVVTLAVMVLQNITKVFIKMFGGVGANWVELVQGNKLTIADAISDLFASIIGWVFKLLIWLETVILNNLVGFLVIVAVLAYSTIALTGKLGKFARWMLSLLLTALVLQPMVVVTLAIGGTTIAAIAIPEGWKVWLAVVLVIIASLMPFFLFYVANREIKTRVENRAQIYGNVNATPRNRPSLLQMATSFQAKLSNINWLPKKGGGASGTGGTGGNTPQLVPKPQQTVGGNQAPRTGPVNPRMYTMPGPPPTPPGVTPPPQPMMMPRPPVDPRSRHIPPPTYSAPSPPPQYLTVSPQNSGQI